MATYTLSGQYRIDGGSWRAAYNGCFPTGKTTSSTYDTYFSRPSQFITDYAGGDQYIVSATLRVRRSDGYSGTETIRFGAGSSATTVVGSYVSYAMAAGTTERSISFTAQANSLLTNGYIIANAATSGNYVELDADKVYLDVTWATSNTAPYWSSGADITTTGTLNGGYTNAGSTITFSWPVCNDTQGNLDHYQYGISTNNGSTYTYYTTTSRSATYSNSTDGTKIKFTVRGVDDAGLTSSWIYSDVITVNYSPGAPTISTIGGAAPSQNMVIAYNASMVLGASSHSGGFSSSYSALNYRQTGSYTGTYATSTTIALINLMNLVGQTASISAQVTDGWDTATSTAYTVKVGKTLSVPTLTPSKSYIDSTTSIVIGSSLIDGAYYSSASESVYLYYSYDGATWSTLWSGTRSYSTRTTANNLTIPNIFYLIHSKDPSFGGTSRDVYFQVVTTTGHLTADNNTYGLILTYSAATISSNISAADGSGTFKYPMNNTIPVTEKSFTVSFTSTKNANFADTLTATLYSKVGTGGSWVSRGTKSITTTSYSSTFFFELATIGMVRGQTIYLKLELTSVANGVTIIHDSVEPTWVGGTNKAIEFRAFPVFTPSVNGSSQLSFIRNGIADNKIIIPLRLTLELSKAYYIIVSAKINTTEWLESATATTINTATTNLWDYSTYISLNSSINPDKTWDVAYLKVLEPLEEGITGLSVPSNANQTITYTFTVWEAYRTSTGANTPEIWDVSFWDRDYNTATLVQTANTYCKPIFDSGTVSFIRK